MKISICGKGGTGKSTLTYLLAKEFEKRNFNVVVIDSDESNTSLYKFFGFKNPPVPLIELVGGKKSIQRRLKQLGGFQLTKSKISVDEIPEPFIRKEGKINLISIGKILQAYEGCACPMGALTKEFLKKLNLKDNEIAIVDTEAGVEHFGRGIEKYIDLVIILINHSCESIDVAEKIKE
ncbi:MAG: P-loop NTPase, partial [Candidatus Altarchaeaceae archaeon]